MYKVVLPQNNVPHKIFSTYLAPAILTKTQTLTLTLTITKLFVVEQNVTGAKSLGYSALGHDVLGQDVGHHVGVMESSIRVDPVFVYRF